MALVSRIATLILSQYKMSVDFAIILAWHVLEGLTANALHVDHLIF